MWFSIVTLDYQRVASRFCNSASLAQVHFRFYSQTRCSSKNHARNNTIQYDTYTQLLIFDLCKFRACQGFMGEKHTACPFRELMTRPWWAWTKGQRPQDLSASLAACRTVLCVAWNMWHISIMIQMHNYKIIPAYDFLPLTIDFFSSITDLSYVLCLSYIIHLVYPHIRYINRYVKHDKNYIF